MNWPDDNLLRELLVQAIKGDYDANVSLVDSIKTPIEEIIRSHSGYPDEYTLNDIFWKTMDAVLDLSFPKIQTIKSLKNFIASIALHKTNDHNNEIRKYAAGLCLDDYDELGIKEFPDHDQRSVISEFTYLNARSAEDIASKKLNVDDLRKIFNNFTEREKQVANLVMAGYRQQEISEILNITPKRVEALKKQINEKLKENTLFRVHMSGFW